MERAMPTELLVIVVCVVIGAIVTAVCYWCRPREGENWLRDAYPWGPSQGGG
jgi:hypothetical protein